jgi:hypothetical protein
LLHLLAQPLRPGTARRWIENNERVFQNGEIAVGFSLFFKPRRRNFRA